MPCTCCQLQSRSLLMDRLFIQLPLGCLTGLKLSMPLIFALSPTYSVFPILAKDYSIPFSITRNILELHFHMHSHRKSGWPHLLKHVQNLTTAHWSHRDHFDLNQQYLFLRLLQQPSHLCLLSSVLSPSPPQLWIYFQNSNRVILPKTCFSALFFLK